MLYSFSIPKMALLYPLLVPIYLTGMMCGKNERREVLLEALEYCQDEHASSSLAYY